MSDKRTVATDALDTLGFRHSEKQHRDAIHLAVEQVTAGSSLKAGDNIGIKNGVAVKGTLKNGVKNLGIADPFIQGGIAKGEQFWLVLYPRMITSLRHVWSHPDFDETPEVLEIKSAVSVPTPKELAYKWISDYAESFGNYYDDDDSDGRGITAEDLISYGTGMAQSSKAGSWGDYLVCGGLLEGESPSGEFWNQLEIYNGEVIDHEHRQHFFSCSC